MCSDKVSEESLKAQLDRVSRAVKAGVRRSSIARRAGSPDVADLLLSDGMRAAGLDPLPGLETRTQSSPQGDGGVGKRDPLKPANDED